jgi:hypothetical protein
MGEGCSTFVDEPLMEFIAETVNTHSLGGAMIFYFTPHPRMVPNG